jgi:hypothetical protein
MSFHELNAFQICTEETLRLPHSLQLLGAIQRNADFKRLEVLTLKGGSQEALIVDVHCDEVPNRNPLGLSSPERLALVVTEGSNGPPEVRALRQEFPNVLHLNATPVGEPRSLCLYFEPHRAVMRTWTAPAFLRRIQWWLLKTWTGELHAADQPVEFPFFDTGWELVVPADFDEQRRRPGVRFSTTAVKPPHRRGTSTLLLSAIQADKDPIHAGVAIVDCPPIVHGSRTDIPLDLGAAADQLATFGLDLARLLRETLQALIAPAGEPLKGSSDRFVILLNIPVCRAPGVAAERIQRLALLTLIGKLDLGLRLGAYSRFQGKAFKDVAIGGALPQQSDWRSVQLLPASAIDAPAPLNFRRYSGTPNEGPKSGVLVGAGALGSELLNLWVRAGWGRWTIIDSDHVKPHNLARHTAFSGQIGEAKATATQALANSVFGRADVVQALVADACDSTDKDVAAALATSSLVVDCSAALDFPRLASTSSHPGRHASLFLTPSGRGSVLLLEDAARLIRLHTLEAQYYRAILNNPWGKKHLQENLGSFWSGASCRDVSHCLPHTSVLAHAANLGEQLMHRHDSPQASIQIWSRQPESGSVQAFDVAVHAPIVRPKGSLVVHTDQGLEEKLRQFRAAALPHETGGILLGYHDLTLGQIVIVDALPAPPDSQTSEGHFLRGVDGLLQVYQEVQRRTGNIVEYLGEWHSHPTGHGAKQSSDDIVQLFNLAVGMVEDGRPALQLIVAEQAVEIYVSGGAL